MRSAYLDVIQQGLLNPICDGGRLPKDAEEIVVSNGATPILIVATGAAIGSAAEDLTCWNKAAWSLQGVLDDAFADQHER
ncbi:MAG: hypothetical protein ACXWVH_03665 [Caulobacteraceae bacterium]